MAVHGTGKRALSARAWSEEDFTLAIDIARRHFFDQQSKVEIGEALGLTRFQVGRFIQEAQRVGIVRIEIGMPGLIDQSLSEQLASLLGLEKAVVIATASSYATSVENIGAALAVVVMESVGEGDVLGLAWSRTTDAMSRKLTTLRPSSVVQLAGHLHVPGQNSGSVELVRRAADASGGDAYPIHAPMVVQDKATADALRALPEVSTALEMASRVTIAAASVGAWAQSTSQLYDALAPELVAEASALGAIGEVAGRVFGADGLPVGPVIDDRVIAVSLEQLHAIPRVILSGFGDYRLDATLAAIRATGAQVLVTDASLARAALQQ